GPALTFRPRPSIPEPIFPRWAPSGASAATPAAESTLSKERLQRFSLKKALPLRVPSEPEPTAPDASPVRIPRIGPSGTPRTHGEDVRTALSTAGTSPQGTRQPQPADPPQNRRQQLAGHRYLRQLEDDVLGVRHHLRPDLDQLLAQGGQAPAADRPRQRQLPQEVRQVVGQGEQLQPRRVVLEPAAGQLGPL